MGINETRPFQAPKARRAVGGIQKDAECFRTKIKRFTTSSESFVERVHPIWRKILSRPVANNEDTPTQISCREVRKELAHYMEDDISLALRERIEGHFLRCDVCFAIYDGLRKVVRLVNSTEIVELPQGFSVRLYRRIVTSSDPQSRRLQ